MVDIFPKFPHLHYPIDFSALGSRYSGQNFYIIEQWMNSVLEPAFVAVLDPVCFSYPGALTTGVESPRWYSPNGVTFTSVIVSRLVVGAADVKIDLNVTGSLIHTVTLASGSAQQTDTIALTLVAAPSDYLTVSVNDQGDGADVDVQLVR